MRVLKEGERLGNYEIIELIGTGGFGHVYKVKKLDTGENQALKLFKKDVFTADQLQERVKRELRSLRRLRSAYVVNVYDLHHHEGLWYLTMEYVEGRGLDALISENDALIEGVAAVPLLVKLAEAIAHCHDEQIVHRDIKPSNVIVQQDGIPRLVDFGIVAILDHPPITEEPFGYRLHLAPEYIKSGDPTTSADIYAFGITMYRVLTKRKPKQEDETPYCCDNPAQTRPVHPTDVSGNVPRWLGDIVMKALE